MSSSSLKETLERFHNLVDEARQSPDYWVEIPIIEFTQEISALMEKQGMSRAELARRLGSSRAYVTKLLDGSANFTLYTMTKVAMALGAAVHVHLAPRDAAVRWKDVSTSDVAARRKKAKEK